MNKIKKFNYEHIYLSDILKPSVRYFDVVINQIYSAIKQCYDGENTFNKLNKLKKFYPNLINGFMEWYNNFSDNVPRDGLRNKVLFNINHPKDFYFAIILYISGMTDKFAIEMYNEIIGY